MYKLLPTGPLVGVICLSLSLGARFILVVANSDGQSGLVICFHGTCSIP